MNQHESVDENDEIVIDSLSGIGNGPEDDFDSDDDAQESEGEGDGGVGEDDSPSLQEIMAASQGDLQGASDALHAKFDEKPIFVVPSILHYFSKSHEVERYYVSSIKPGRPVWTADITEATVFHSMDYLKLADWYCRWFMYKKLKITPVPNNG